MFPIQADVWLWQAPKTPERSAKPQARGGRLVGEAELAEVASSSEKSKAKVSSGAFRRSLPSRGVAVQR